MVEPGRPSSTLGASPDLPSSPRAAAWLWAVCVAVAVVATFLPAVGNDFVAWDDDLNITENPFFRGLGPAELRWMFTTTLGGHYQPLSWLTLGLDYALWGMNPRGYHLTSVFLHGGNAVWVYVLALVLLRRALPDATPRALRAAAAVAALVFGVHPLRVESVAWVSERR